MAALRALHLRGVALGLAAFGLLCCSCNMVNPLQSTPSPPSSTALNQQPEPLNVPGVFFAPQNNIDAAIQFLANPPLTAPYAGAFLDVGTDWKYATVGPGVTTYNTAPFSTNALLLPPALTTTESHYYNWVWLRTGDQFSNNTSDYYARLEGSYTGSGIPNGSTNYMELPIFYSTNAGPGVDIRSYHGFSFWTRGTGNFSVCLLSGSQQGSPPAPGPYIQLNLYQYLFSNYLTGSTQWRQVVVYFPEMTQTYGLATNLQDVLENFYGLQFMQMGSPGPPVQYNFWLDVDYIRFF